MNYKIPIILFASLMFFPAFGQEMALNDSLSMAKFDINWNDFNIPSRDATIIPFDEIINTTRASFAAIDSLKEGKWISVK